MKQLRFYAESDGDRNWRVIDTVTGKPASLNGQICCLLDKADAEGIVDYLHRQLDSPATKDAAA